MKKRDKIFVLIVIGSLAVIKIINIAPNFSIFNIPINWFPRIERRGAFDETWDYVIIDNPEKTGRNKWEIGLVDNKINIYETASAPTVQVRVFKEIDMNYTSREDYDRRGGHEAFRKFVEENNK